MMIWAPIQTGPRIDADECLYLCLACSTKQWTEVKASTLYKFPSRHSVGTVAFEIRVWGTIPKKHR